VLARASGFFIAETQPKNLSLGGCVHRVTAGMVCAVEFSDDGVSTVWRDIRRRDGYRITSTHHANGCQVGPERGCSEPVAVSGRCEAHQPLRRVTHDPRTPIALFLMGEPVVVELLLDWLDPFLTVEEQDRLLGWHLGVSL